MRKIRILLIGITISCSSQLDKEEFIAWVKDYDNCLRAKKEHGNYVFDLQFQPADYVRLQRGSHASSEELKAIQHYTLTIGTRDNQNFLSSNVSNHIEKQQRLYYFSYLFHENIKLEENGKILPCVLYHFEKGIGKESTFVLGFESAEVPSKEAKLIIESEQFGSLPIKIKISKDNIPSLKAYDESNL